MKKQPTLDAFEQAILSDYESGVLVSSAPTKAELKKYQDAARATFIKDRRINIRLSSPDVMDLQARAAEEGIPYQTMITSILHKFATGRLTEKRPAAHPRTPKHKPAPRPRVHA